MKRILFVLRPVEGGIKKYILTLIRGLDKNKFKIYLASPENIIIDNSSCKDIVFIPLKIKGEINPILDIIAIKNLIKIAKKEKIDIISSQGFKATFLSAIVEKLTNIPTVSTIHTFLFSPLWSKKKIKIYRLLAKFFFKYIKKVIVVSRSIGRELENIGVDKNKMVIIYNGISCSMQYKNIDTSITKEKFGFKKESFVVGNISRFVSHKGIEYFLKAIPEVINKHPQIRFLLVGDGPEKENILNIVSHLHIENLLTILPYQKNIENLLGIIDILVVSSVTEGLPYTVLEAMLYGIPVVATEVGGIPEIIEDEKDGILIPPYSASKISEKIINLFEDESKRKKISYYGRKKIMENFTEDIMIKKTEDVYLDVIKDLCFF